MVKKEEKYSHIINPIDLRINKGKRIHTGIDDIGAYVLITESFEKYEWIIFVGAIHLNALLELRSIVKLFKCKYLKKVEVACHVYFDATEAQKIKKEIRTIKEKDIYSEAVEHCFNVLDKAADIIIEKPEYFIHVDGY